MHLKISVVFLIFSLIPVSAFSSEEHDEHGPNIVSVFLGGSQKDDEHGDEVTEFAWAVGYSRRLNHRFAIQILYEEVGGDIDTRSLIVPLHIRLGDTKFDLALGPGVEHEKAHNEDVFLFRAGLGMRSGWKRAG